MNPRTIPFAAISLLFASTLATPILHAQETVLVTLKLIKSSGAAASVPVALHFPATCAACSVIDDPAYARQNTREVILAMRVSKSTALPLEITTPAGSFRRVLLETVDLPFSATATGMVVTLPAQIADRPDSGELQTHLYWPGIELRFEHADPARRAGDYATGTFPLTERRAAQNLEFGLLEAIRRLGLDHYVDDDNLGRLFLMGFDTNYPHGHLDSPPHFHLSFWLPTFHGTGTITPHLYLTPQGLISHSITGPYRVPTVQNEDYLPGIPFHVVDSLGHPIYTLTITHAGALTFARFDGPTCTLTPIPNGPQPGFASGTTVTCPNFPPLTVQVEDDLTQGEIHEIINNHPAATYHYDPDSGLQTYP